MAKPKDPTLLIVTGDEDFLRRRTVQDVVQAKTAEGWKIEQVDGAEEGSVEDALGAGGLFSKIKTLVVVENPEKVEIEVYTAHVADTSSSVVLLLNYEGNPAANTKFGKFVAAHKTLVKECKAPKRWEAAEFATAFCVKEALRHGLKLDSALAAAVVERAGSDLGVLSFEILKFAMVCRADKTQEITPAVVRQGLAVVLEAELQPVINALADRNVKKLCASLDHVYRTTKNDMTVTLCRVLGGTVMQWISMADLKTRGKSPDEAAALLELNPWFYRTKLLPQINQWSRSELINLLQALALSERTVLSGAVSPWQGLVSRLVDACNTK